ncbi:trimethyllysine dioxygenase [Cryptococcus neoformans]|nr:trimethyllysine dioxygenase [Cryptococcus neoformans var. grubii]
MPPSPSLLRSLYHIHFSPFLDTNRACAMSVARIFGTALRNNRVPRTAFRHSANPNSKMQLRSIVRYRHSPPNQEFETSSAEIRVNSTTITIKQPDQDDLQYDHFYLFDHCRCPQCFHPHTKQRLKTLSQIPSDIHPTAVALSTSGLHVTWSTPFAHTSFFPAGFLKRVADETKLSEHVDSQDDRTLWNFEISKSPPYVEYDDIMSQQVHQHEQTVLQVLNKVHRFGFCFVTGVPIDAKETETLIKSISPIRHTHYGGFWSFTADLAHGDLAYSAQSLPAHTDTTYFTDPAGLQIFHLLSHPSPGQGGKTLLVDGFHAASQLSAVDPASYSVLSRLPIPAHASGTKGTLLRPQISFPVLRHDECGRLAQVRWNNEDRGIIGHGWSATEVRHWYQAAQRFESLVKSEQAEYWVQLNPGTMLIIDNWRVMHGRSEFTGSRTMCGAYIGADDWHSRRAVLTERYGDVGEMDDIWRFGW